MTSNAHDGPGIYKRIFFALLGLTLLTVVVAYIDMGRMNDVMALGIASLKAAMVLLYFMHVRENSGYTILVIASGVAFFLVLVAFTMSDVLTREIMGVVVPIR